MVGLMSKFLLLNSYLNKALIIQWSLDNAVRFCNSFITGIDFYEKGQPDFPIPPHLCITRERKILFVFVAPARGLFFVRAGSGSGERERRAGIKRAESGKGSGTLNFLQESFEFS